MMLLVLARLGEVHDGQHHENEGLQRNYKDVEGRPDESQDDLSSNADPAAGAYERAKTRRQREQCDQQKNHLPGVEIAEKPQREGDGFCERLDDAEQQIERKEPGTERMYQERLQIAARALHLDVVVDDERKDRERERKGDVEIRARHDLQVLKTYAAGKRRQKIDRHEIHEIEKEHPAEDGERERRDEPARAREGVLHLGVDKLDDEFDEILELAGHACAAADRLARRDVESSAEEHREHDRKEHAVPMDDGEIDDALRLPVLQEVQVMNDVLVGAQGFCDALCEHVTYEFKFAFIACQSPRFRRRRRAERRQQSCERHPINAQGRHKRRKKRRGRNLEELQYHHEQYNDEAELNCLADEKRAHRKLRIRSCAAAKTEQCHRKTGECADCPAQQRRTCAQRARQRKTQRRGDERNRRLTDNDAQRKAPRAWQIDRHPVCPRGRQQKATSQIAAHSGSGFAFTYARTSTYGPGAKPRNYREEPIKRLLNVRQDAVEFVEAVVADDELAAPRSAVLDGHRDAELLGHILSELFNIGVGECALRRLPRRTLQTAHQSLGVAH